MMIGSADGKPRIFLYGPTNSFPPIKSPINVPKRVPRPIKWPRPSSDAGWGQAGGGRGGSPRPTVPPAMTTLAAPPGKAPRTGPLQPREPNRFVRCLMAGRPNMPYGPSHHIATGPQHNYPAAQRHRNRQTERGWFYGGVRDGGGGGGRSTAARHRAPAPVASFLDGIRRGLRYRAASQDGGPPCGS